jgi:hypothetical protein
MHSSTVGERNLDKNHAPKNRRIKDAAGCLRQQGEVFEGIFQIRGLVILTALCA